MGILGKSEVQVPLVQPLDQSTSEVVPNAGAKELTNVVFLKNGEVERRPGFVEVLPPPSFPSGHSAGSVVDYLDSKTILTKNKVYLRNGNSLTYAHDFFKSSIDSKEIGTIKNYHPYSFDMDETSTHVFVAIYGSHDESPVGGEFDLAISRYNKATKEYKTEVFTLVGLSGLIRSIDYPDISYFWRPIVIKAISDSVVRVFYLVYGHIFYRDVNIDSLTIGPQTTFKDNTKHNLHINKVFYNGDWHIVVFEETSSSMGSLLVSPMTGTFSPVAAATGTISAQIFLGEIADVYFNQANNTIHFLIGISVQARKQSSERYLITKNVVNLSQTIAVLPSIFTPWCNSQSSFDDLKYHTGSRYQFAQQIYSHGQILPSKEPGYSCMVVDFNRVMPYTIHYYFGLTGNLVTEDVRFNGSGTTSSASKLIHQPSGLAVSICHINDCYVNESETLEENYRTYYLASFNRKDMNDDAILIDKVDEFDALFVRGSVKGFLQEVAPDTYEGYFVTFKNNKYADDKTTSEFTVTVHRCVIGEGVKITSSVQEDDIVIHTTGRLPFAAVEGGVGRPFTVFPTFKPRVLPKRSDILFDSGATSNTTRFVWKYNNSPTANTNKIRFYDFPHGSNIISNTTLVISTWNGSAWVNHNCKLFFDVPFAGPGIDVQIRPYDDALTIGYKCIAAIANTLSAFNSHQFYPLGNGQFYYGGLTTTATDNTTTNTVSLSAHKPSVFTASTATNFSFVAQSEMANNSRSGFCAPSLPVQVTIRANSNFTLSLIDPGFNNCRLLTKRYYIFMTMPNGSQFYATTHRTYIGDERVALTLGRTRVYPVFTIPFNPAPQQQFTAMTPYVTTRQTELTLNPLAPWTGGVIQDGPLPSNVIGFFRFRNRLGLVTKDGRIQFSKSLTSQSQLLSFPLELQLESQAFNDRIVSAVGLSDKLLVQTLNTIYAVFGDTFNDTLTAGGFSEPRKLLDVSSDLEIAQLKFSDEQVAFLFASGTIFLVNQDLSVVNIGRTVSSFLSDAFFRELSMAYKVLSPEVDLILWPNNGNPSGLHLIFDKNAGSFVLWTNNSQVMRHIGSGVFAAKNLSLKKLSFDTRTDGTPHFSHKIDTGWISAKQVQDFYRIFKLLILGRYFTPHTVKVTVQYNYDSGLTSTHNFNSSDIMASSNVYQLLIHPTIQKVQSIRLIIEMTPTGVVGSFKCASLSNLTAHVGLKEGAWRVQSSKRG